ncbi:hypothetical protein PINS_up008058 [Pythium insidiosum]|nr:hypothetical protein PINS_up008058 [Pythium insidiosum]
MRVISIDRPARRQAALDAEALRRREAADVSTPWSQLLSTTAAASRQWQQRRLSRGIGRRTGDHEPEVFADNVVVTAKYSVLNFAPRVFLAQLRRPSNIYFLFIAVLQSIKEVSNTSGVPTILLPLTIVFICSAIKEALEDRERHRADALTNSREVLALSALGEWELKQWGDLQVGDIVKVRDGEQMPADLLLLNSEEIDHDDAPAASLDALQHNDTGADAAVAVGSRPSKGGTLAYIETKSLDGETNLKIRSAIPLVATMASTSRGLSTLRGMIECEQPNSRINSFEGTCTIQLDAQGAMSHGVVESQGRDDHHVHEKRMAPDGSVTLRFPLTAKQMMLRSCVLLNTTSVTGLVIFTGHETKVFCSNTEPVVKSSSVEQRLNVLIVGIVLIQQLVCLLGAILGAFWMITKGNTHWYLQFEEHTPPRWSIPGFPPIRELLKLHLRYFIIMQNFVPISLNVSLEFVKYWQAYFMEQDLEMYDEVSDSPAMVRSSALNEDLGRVHHIFTDKTGTLTMNLMLFRFCMIGRKHYGGEIRDDEMESKEVVPGGRHSTPSRFVQFDPTDMFADLSAGGSQAASIQLFLRHLALCHTLIPAKSFKEMCSVTIPEYSASSPDEQALVSAAAYCNVRFVHRTPVSMSLLEPGSSEPIVYKILNLLEFDSDRKRMSVILERPDGVIELMCKGADNVILERLAMTPGQAERVDEVYNQLSVYAKYGMRTLCLAYKRIDRDEYDSWNARFAQAHSSMEELVKRRQGLPNAIDPLMNEIEQDLCLLGVTAVQDKLQQGVPQTLEQLQQTSMKVWTLTGDKMETAVNIGYACNLLSNGMLVKQVSCEDPVSTMKQLQEILDRHNEKASLSASTDESASITSTPRRKRRRTLHKNKNGSFWKSLIRMITGGKAPSSRVRRDRRKKGKRSAASMASTQGKSVHHSLSSTGVYDSDEMDDAASNDERGALLATGPPIIRRRRPQVPALALVIDGSTLEHALHPQLRSLFYEVSKICRSVICCRVSPKQKADVVDLIRDFEPESITLAIGDGANDVGMIQAAHIGVGISGQEGTQAVNASDYAIAQFRFLQRLLFVHGRWAYRRVAKLMSYMLYKNVTYVLTTFWFGCFCGFSGQPLIIDIAAQSFNLIYTSLPLVLFAVFDQDVSSEAAEKFPQLYKLGQKNVLLARRVFWPWILNGIWHSLIIFFFSSWGYEGDLAIQRHPTTSPAIEDPQGRDDGLVTLGFVVFTNLVLVVNLKLCLETFMITWYFAATVTVSTLLWFVVGNLISSSNSRIVQAIGEMPYLQKSPSFWILCILVITMSLLRDVIWKVFRRLNLPSTYHILQEREKLSLRVSPRSVFGKQRRSGWSSDEQGTAMVDYTQLFLRQIPPFESEQDSFARSSPLGEKLIGSSGITDTGSSGVRARGSFHASGSGSGWEEADELLRFGDSLPSTAGSLPPGPDSALARHSYHGYAFSEDENIDSDVEAASSSSSPRGVRKPHSASVGSADAAYTSTGGRRLKKMLKSVRGQKTA